MFLLFSLNQTETKAASNLVNCGCQCSSLTFRDAKGEVQVWSLLIGPNIDNTDL